MTIVELRTTIRLMTSPDIKPSAPGIGDPIPTDEIPLQERGERIFMMIDEFRDALIETPAFGQSLATNHLSNFENSASIDPHKDGVYFKKDGSEYVVRFSSEVRHISDSNMSRTQAMAIDVHQRGEYQKVVLSGTSENGVFSSAIVNNVMHSERVDTNVNKAAAFNKNQAVLNELRAGSRKR